MKLKERIYDIQRRAESGDSFAQTVFGFLVEFGFGVIPDDGRARLWYERAASANHKEAQYEYAQFLLRQGDEDDAIVWLRKSAESKYAPALSLLGGVYVEGGLVPQDTSLGLKLINDAASQNHVPSLRYLSSVYEKGVLVKKDAALSGELLRKAAELEDAGAQYLFGTLLLDSKNKKEQMEGVNWIFKAAEKNNKYANLFLGEMYGLGLHGIKKDQNLSEFFFKRAKQI